MAPRNNAKEKLYKSIHDRVLKIAKSSQNEESLITNEDYVKYKAIMKRIDSVCNVCNNKYNTVQKST